VEPFDGSPEYHRFVAACLPCRLLMRIISSPRRALILNGKQFKRGQTDHAAFPAGNMKVFKWPHSSSSSPCRAMSRYGASDLFQNVNHGDPRRRKMWDSATLPANPGRLLQSSGLKLIRQKPIRLDTGRSLRLAFSGARRDKSS
jgi:hypothetical protein